MADPEELIPEDSNCRKRKPVDYDPEKCDPSKYQKNSDVGLDLQNCSLISLSNIHRLVESALFYPDRLIYLDVRCNRLTSLDGIERLQSLKILYAHGNKLQTVKELLVLQKLPRLEALTIHGNPLVRQVNYKYWVILTFSQLKRLDFSGITQVDRRNAEQARKMNQITLRVDSRVVV